MRDAGSDYYTDRQRRLIFTQLLNQKNYHYKTNKETEKENQEKALMPTDQELDDLVKDLWKEQTMENKTTNNIPLDLTGIPADLPYDQ